MRPIPRFAPTAAVPGRFGSLAVWMRPLLLDQSTSRRWSRQSVVTVIVRLVLGGDVRRGRLVLGLATG
jgi:hypothetical protein